VPRLTISGDEYSLAALADACGWAGLRCWCPDAQEGEAEFGWVRDTAKGRKNPSPNRYKNTETGQVRYFKTPPKGAEAAGETPPPDEQPPAAEQQSGEQQPAAPAAAEETPAQTHTAESLKATLQTWSREEMTGEEGQRRVKELSEALAGSMTKKDLIALRDSLGIAGGQSLNKTPLAARIIERGLEAARAEGAQAGEPAAGPPAEAAPEEAAPEAADAAPAEALAPAEEAAPGASGDDEDGPLEIGLPEETDQAGSTPEQRQAVLEAGSSSPLDALVRQSADAPEGGKWLAAMDATVKAWFAAGPEGQQAMLKEAGLRPDASQYELTEVVAARAKPNPYYPPERVVRDQNEKIEQRTGKVHLTEPTVKGQVAARQHLKGVLDAGFAASNLGGRKQRSYRAAAEKATARMPERALERLASNLKRTHWVDGSAGILDSVVADMKAIPDDPQRVREVYDTLARVGKAGGNELPPDVVQKLNDARGDPEAERRAVREIVDDTVAQFDGLRGPEHRIGGCYNAATQSTHMDGGIGTSRHAGPKEFRMERGDSQAAVYAHEFVHAIDGPDYEISRSATWGKLWQQELVNDQLTGYAGTMPKEGLAEFGRLVYGGQVDLAAVEREFPGCAKFFKDHELWPTA
jgi:hypothetical protein